MTIAAVTGGATITSTWGNSVADAINNGDTFTPWAKCSLSGTPTGTFATCTAASLTTNDTSTFGALSSNAIPILRAGRYRVVSNLVYYSVAAIGAASTYFHVEHLDGGTIIRAYLDHASGHYKGITLVSDWTVASTGSILTRHADTAGRSAGLQLASTMIVTRLGDA